MKNPQKTSIAVLALVLISLQVPTRALAGQPFKWPTASDKPAKQPDQAATDAPPASKADDISRPADKAKDSDSANSATNLDPRRPFAPEAIKHYNKGVELHGSGFLNQAIEEYKAAIAADGRLEPAWSNLGNIYAAQRSYNRAMEAFQKSLELKPDRATTLNGLATVLYARGKVKEAKEKWMQAFAADPKFSSALYNIGNACEGEKKPQEAINWYVKAIDISPKMPDPYYRVGSIYFKDKHYPQAEVMLEKAIDTTPDGDFVKDARHMLETIHATYAKDMTALGDVRMSVVPPHNDSPADGQATASAPRAVSQAEPAAVQEADNVAQTQTKIKKKKKKNSSQTAESDDASNSTAQDLDQKPQQ